MDHPSRRNPASSAQRAHPSFLFKEFTARNLIEA
jgi:hypothetical protein